MAPKCLFIIWMLIPRLIDISTTLTANLPQSPRTRFPNPRRYCIYLFSLPRRINTSSIIFPIEFYDLTAADKVRAQLGVFEFGYCVFEGEDRGVGSLGLLQRGVVLLFCPGRGAFCLFSYLLCLGMVPGFTKALADTK